MEKWCADLVTRCAPDLLVLVDPEMRIVWTNEAVQRLLGIPVGTFWGTGIVEFIHPEDLDQALGAIAEAERNDGYHIATRVRVLDASGGYVETRVTSSTVEEAGRTWFILSIRSIDDEEAIESRRRRLRGLATTFYVECAAMEWVEEEERSTSLLAALAAVLGAEEVSLGEVVDQVTRLHTVAGWDRSSGGSVGRGTVETVMDLEHLRGIPCEFLEQDGGATVRIWLESQSGTAAGGVVRLRFDDLPDQWDDANADVVSLMCSSLLATVGRCQRERSMAMAATRDPLTGLLNRTAMHDRLAELMTVTRLGPDSLAVFFADLNDFKRLNDNQGHQAGDDVLKAVADALRDSIKPGDLAARVGGDEFVVVMLVRQWSLDRLSARLRRAVEGATSRWPGVGVAIGAITVEEQDTPDEVLQRADLAMYQDKRSRSAKSHRNDVGNQVSLVVDQGPHDGQ